MSAPLCPRCGRPMTDTGYVCHPCAAALMARLGEVGPMLPEMVTTIARLDRLGDGGTGDRLPWAEAASRAATTITAALTSWAVLIAATRGVTMAPRETLSGPLCGGARMGCHHDSCHAIADREGVLQACARLIAEHAGWLRMRPDAERAWRELHEVCDLLERTVDRPAATWYAGACWADTVNGKCPAELHVKPGAAWIRCPACGTQHDVAERRAWLIQAARDHLASATDIARFLCAYGHRITSDRIRQWAKRRRLLAHGTDGVHALYRVGDAIALLDSR
jgi:hypothetical protein